MATATENEERIEVLMNFRASPELRKQARLAAAKADIALTHWLRQTVEQRLEQEKEKVQ